MSAKLPMSAATSLAFHRHGAAQRVVERDGPRASALPDAALSGLCAGRGSRSRSRAAAFCGADAAQPAVEEAPAKGR